MGTESQVPDKWDGGEPSVGGYPVDPQFEAPEVVEEPESEDEE